jgi:hypothetical protein
LSFPNEVVGVTSGSMTATFKNTLKTPVAITNIATSGFLGIFGGTDDFAVSGGNCPRSPTKLGAGDSCSITVTFTPTAVGSQSATLNVTDSSGGNPTGVSLTGTGIAAITLSAGSLTFSSQSLGTTSAPQTVTLTNKSSASVTVSPVTITGDFAISSNTCTSVTSGHTCTVGVTFTPAATGSLAGTLTINDTGVGSPELVSLMGTGAAATGLVSIAVTPASPSVAEGLTQQFTAMGTFTNPSHVSNLTNSVTWTSSAKSVATISNTSGTQGLASTVGLGPTTITAALGSIHGSTTLTVTSPTLVSIAVTPADPTISLSAKQQFTATGTYTNSSMQDVTDTVTWSSSAMGVATISNTSGTQGVATATGLGPTTIEAASGLINGSTTLTVIPGASVTGSLNTARYLHTATLLNNGMVLVVGGILYTPPPPCYVLPCAPGTSTVLASAELYNPATGLFTATTGSLNTARYGHTATLLPDGTVLIAGGTSAAGASGPFLSTAELYNPATETFSYTTNDLNTARYFQTASLLSNGMVLLAGGYNAATEQLASAELYNPATASETFTYTGSLNTARYYDTATTLNNGSVLLVGGDDFTYGILGSAELYSAGSFALTSGSLNTPRYLDTATLLNDGTVLLAGGYATADVLNSAELYSAENFAYTTGSLNTARCEHTGTLLSNGTVLLAGGYNLVTGALTSEELYNPATGTFAATGGLTNARNLHTATLLNNETVLLVGGQGASGASLASAEVYEPATLTPPNLESIAVTPAAQTISLSGAPNLQFIATGTFSGTGPEQLASVTWSSSNPAIVQISNDSTNHGQALAVATGTVTITATAGTISGSTTLKINP